MFSNLSSTYRFISLILFFLFALQSCNKNTSKKQKERFPKSIAKIKEIYNEGRYRDLLDILIKNKKRLAKSYQFWNMYGLTLRINAYLDKDPELRKDEIDAFKKALDLKPDFIEARFNLATSLWETDHIKEACKEYSAVLKVNPEHPDKENMLIRLKKCKPEAKTTTTDSKQKLISKKNHQKANSVSTVKKTSTKINKPSILNKNPTDKTNVPINPKLKKSPSIDDKNNKKVQNKSEIPKSDKKRINKNSPH